jgi:RND family efflux transporter MFP subunit
MHHSQSVEISIKSASRARSLPQQKRAGWPHLSAIGALLAIAGCAGRQSQEQATVTVPVSVTEITPRPIAEFLQTTGTVVAEKQATITSDMTAYYALQTNPRTAKPYALGDMVAAGETIIRLHDVDYENSTRVESQKLSLDIAKKDLERQQSLYQKGGVSAADLNNSQLALTNAQYNYDDASQKESKLRVRAPFAGVIVALPYYTKNTRVTSGQAMATIMDFTRLHLETKLPANDMARMHVGQSVLVSNYTLPNDTIRGQVTEVSPAIDPTSRTFQTVFVIDNPAKKFRPGMFVKADVVVARKDSALVVPKEVVLSDQKGMSVFIVDRGRAQMRTIKKGIESENEIEVTEGLRPGERLVIKGFETLQDGSRVKVLE